MTEDQQLRRDELAEITGYGWLEDADPILVEEFHILNTIWENRIQDSKNIQAQKDVAELELQKAEIRFRGNNMEKIWGNTPDNFSKSDKIYYVKYDESFHAADFEIIFSEKRGQFSFSEMEKEILKANQRCVALWSMSRNA